jgi:hypothetical protein
MTIMSADLRGKVKDIGPMRLLRAEWWDPDSRFVLLRYALHDHEEPLGLRMDLDKGAILDQLDSPDLDQRLNKCVRHIWHVVLDERSKAGVGK